MEDLQNPYSVPRPHYVEAIKEWINDVEEAGTLEDVTEPQHPTEGPEHPDHVPRPYYHQALKEWMENLEEVGTLEDPEEHQQTDRVPLRTISRTARSLPELIEVPRPHVYRKAPSF